MKGKVEYNAVVTIRKKTDVKNCQALKKHPKEKTGAF